MALRRTTDATSEPVTVEETKRAVRVIASAEDAEIEQLIKDVRPVAEKELRRSLMTQTWTKTLDQFPDAIELPYPPIIDVTSLKYFDANGVQQTMDPSLYTVDSQSEPGWIVPAYGTSWPDTLAAINAVEVVYRAGYASAAAVPPQVKRWIKLMVGHYYENREASMPGVSIVALPFLDHLLDGERILGF